MENFKKTFNLYGEFKNIVVIRSLDELKKYEEKKDIRYIWEGNGEEYEKYKECSINLMNSLKKLFGDNWNKGLFPNEVYLGFAEQIKKMDQEKNVNNFQAKTNEMMEYLKSINKEVNKEYADVVIECAKSKIDANRYKCESVPYYSNFFNERENITNPNTIGLSSGNEKIKFSRQNPESNILILDFDLELPQGSVLDVYGNVMAKNINAGLIGCHNLMADNINAIKLVASNVEASNLIINPKNMHIGFESLYFELTQSESVSREVLYSLDGAGYEDYDILIGDIEVVEPSLAHSYKIGLQDADEFKSETFVNVEFDVASKFSGGNIKIKNDLAGAKIWGGSISASRIICKDIKSGCESFDYNVPVSELRKMYESQEGYKFRELYPLPIKQFEGRTIESSTIICNNVASEQIKCDAILSEGEVKSKFIKAKNVNASSIISDYIDCNSVVAKNLISGKVNADSVVAENEQITENLDKNSKDNLKINKPKNVRNDKSNEMEFE